MSIQLTLPCPPLLNRYYRKYRNIMVISADGQAFKQEVAAICRNADTVPYTGAVSLSIVVYRKQKRGDIDGFCKALLDSLQGYLYEDDKQIEELHIIRRDDKHNPRCEIEINYLGAIE